MLGAALHGRLHFILNTKILCSVVATQALNTKIVCYVVVSVKRIMRHCLVGVGERGRAGVGRASVHQRHRWVGRSRPGTGSGSRPRGLCRSLGGHVKQALVWIV